MPLYDFKCEAGHTSERFVSSDTKEVDCNECGLPAVKQLSSFGTWTEKRDGTTSDNWVKKREQKIALERKANS
jgi:putative FmdB family regulatory protein